MKLIKTKILAVALALAAPVALPVVAQAQAIQTQMSTNASADVDVVKAQVAGDIMTIVLMFKNTAGKKANFDLNTAETYYIDKSVNKKFFMLKDSENRYVASEVRYYSSSSGFNFELQKGARKMVWMKFPAPAAGVETIDFSMAGVLPFDGLKVSR